MAFSGLFLDWPYLFQIAVLGGFLGGLFQASASGEHGPARAREAHLPRKERRLWQRRLVISSVVGVLVALSFAGHFPSMPGYSLGDWLHDGLIFGGAIALGCLLLLVTYVDSPGQAVSSTRTQRGTRLGHLVLTIHIRPALLVTIFFGLSYGLSFGLPAGLGAGLSFGSRIGLTSILVSLTLMLLARNVRLTDHLRWSWRGLLESLRSRTHIRIVLLVTGMVTMLIGLGDGLENGLSFGLSSGLSYWLLFGLFQSVASEQIDDQYRQIPNQGIRRSIRNSLLLGCISSLLILPLSLLSEGLSVWLSEGLQSVLELGLSEGLGYVREGLKFWLSYVQPDGLSVGLSTGLCGGLLVCAVSGGVAAWRHCIIRLLLRRAGAFPPHYVRFLDEAADCLLLQKVGGGYIFMHRLLLEYCASLESAALPGKRE